MDVALIGSEGSIAVVDQDLADVHQFVPGLGLLSDTASIKDVHVVPNGNELRSVGEVDILAVALNLGQDIVRTNDALAVGLTVGFGINGVEVLFQIHHLIQPQLGTCVGVGFEHGDLGTTLQRRAQSGLNVSALERNLDGNAGVFLHKCICCSQNDLTVVRSLSVRRPERNVCLQAAVFSGFLNFGCLGCSSSGSCRSCGFISRSLAATASEYAEAQDQNQQ